MSSLIKRENLLSMRHIRYDYIRVIFGIHCAFGFLISRYFLILKLKYLLCLSISLRYFMHSSAFFVYSGKTAKIIAWIMKNIYRYETWRNLFFYMEMTLRRSLGKFTDMDVDVKVKTMLLFYKYNFVINLKKIKLNQSYPTYPTHFDKEKTWQNQCCALMKKKKKLLHNFSQVFVFFLKNWWEYFSISILFVVR